MENCHNNQSTWATTINNSDFIEANAINSYTKNQVYPHTASGELIFE